VSQRFVLGLDLGGGAIRALLVEVETRAPCVSARPWRFTPAAADLLMALDFDPEETWRDVGAVVRDVRERARAAPEQILGIAAASMRHGSVVLDAEGDVLLAAPNRDARGALANLDLAAKHGEALRARTGRWPSSIMPAGRLRWMASERPALFERAHVHLSIGDWIGYRLTGEIATEPTQAGETLALDLETRAWAPDLIERIGLPAHLFPELREPGARLGTLLDGAASHLGLRAGTPVAVGAADTQCGMLGAGAIAPGDLGMVVGTSAPVQLVLDRVELDADGRLWTSPHVAPGRCTLESNAGGVGEALEWIAAILYADARHPVLHLLDEASRSLPGASGIRSTFGAGVMDARELALPVGHLTLSHMLAADDPDRRRHLARAVLEGLVYALRANAEQIAEVTGALPPQLVLTGGLSRSAVFAQLLADVAGCSVMVPEVHEGTALGAALCAGLAAGVYADLEAGVAALHRVARCHAPDPAAAAAYRELVPDWRRLMAKQRDADLAASPGVLRHMMATRAAPESPEASFRPRILVASEMDEESLETLRALGEVEYASFRTAMRMLTGPALVEALRGVHVFVTEIDVVDATALSQCDDLRAIVVCRGDAVNVDVDACTALGLPVLHTPARNADAVADLTLAFMLMLARKLVAANGFLREPGGEAGDMGRLGRAFGQLQGRELWHKTVGLVGLGAVGRKVVARLRGFGARILVHDPYLSDDAIRLEGAEPAGLGELLSTSDFVSLHASVTDASRGMIGERELAGMREGSFLVNTARAALLDEEALVRALTSGPLGGAALDVFAVEPPAADHPLLALPNVLATPHVGGNTADVAAHQGRIVARELSRLRRGKAPLHCLNPQTLDSWSWARPRPRPTPEVLERIGRGAEPAVSDLQKDGAPGGKAVRPAVAAPKPPASAAAQAGTGPDAGIRARFEAVLAAFTEGIAADAALARFADGAGDVDLHFVVSDLGSEFHVGFAGGAVRAGLGAPEREAAVGLKLSADLLDGMFTGRRNPMQAAMDGELSFSGDAAKAMTLNQLQGDLERLYRAARERAGDPGDLSNVAAPREAATKARDVAADDVRHELVEVVRELYEAQLITSTGGNVSARARQGDAAWITPSQLFKGDLSPEVLVRIGMRGRALDPDSRSPSSEALMHAAVYRARPEVQAVIHCHAPQATILANVGLPFLPVSTEAAFLANIGRIPFVMPGTQELADAVVEALGEGWAVLMRNHGLLVAGRSLRRCADMCEIVERSCEVILGCFALGKEPPTLPEETVKTLSRYGDLMA
jgi:autoinducer 2 (AI-2) kinase